jgi:hypothetical protein
MADEANKALLVEMAMMWMKLADALENSPDANDE